ncbi:MAG TPA: hypothetical protein VGM19_10800 [Armatimonadota bacterium]|jgi:hypothetical protein
MMTPLPPLLVGLPEGPGEPGPTEPFPDRRADARPPLDRWLPLAAALLSLLVRAPLATRLPPTWDSVQYVLGVLHYDVALHQPHPPGYFLYVFAAKLLHLLGLSPYAALVALSLLGGAGLVALLTAWAGQWGGRGAAITAAVLTILSPLAWNAATTGDTYAVSGCLSALVGYLCWRLYTRPGESAVPAALALGVAGGMRPTDALFLLPLWLLSTGRRGGRALLVGIVTLAAATAAWVLPLLQSTGGLQHYREISHHLSAAVLQVSPLAAGADRLGVHLGLLGVAAGSLLFAGWVLVPFTGGEPLRRARLFLVIWAAPALLFYLSVHMGVVGYLMLPAPPLLLLAALGGGRIVERSAPGRAVPLLVIVAGLNLLFLVNAVVEAQREQAKCFDEITSGCSRELGPDTVVLATRGGGPGGHGELPYRTAMYLLPQSRVFLFPLESAGPEGGVPNAGQNLESSIVTAPLRLTGVRKLLLTGPSLRADLPPGTLLREVVSNPEGQISEVLLEPQTPLVLGPGPRLSFRAIAP